MSKVRGASPWRCLSRSSRALCLGLLLGACGATTQRVNAELEAELPADLRPDYDSFMVHCSKCHGVERALNSHVNSVRHWDLYVAKMMRTAGSGISRKDSPKILRFLYWYTERENEARAAGGKSNKRTLPPLPAETSAGPASAGADAPVRAPAHDDPETNFATENSSVQGTQGESAP